MTTYDPDFWVEQGQKLLSNYFEHFIKLLMESFSIEIVWQITTVIVKSCEQPTVFLQKLFCYDISGFFNRIGNTMLLHSNILNSARSDTSSI